VEKELYLGFADTDATAPPEKVAELKRSLEEAKVPHKLDVFTDTLHGFCFPEKSMYAPIAAENSWAAMFNMWSRTLRA
jgi:carboxymethylenebutenolidase